MPQYRSRLPQQDGGLFLSDGGMGTTLLFHEGLELPHFCAFHLLDDQDGRETLMRYFRHYTAAASEMGLGFVLDSGPTWRASSDWGDKLGYSARDLDRINRSAIEMMCELRATHEHGKTPIVISGCMGPRGDGYEPGDMASAESAERYHSRQIATFADTEADFVTAMTMTYAEEAIGITRAAMAARLPVVISFTVETDGRLPTGQSLEDAVNQVDDATSGGPAYYMVNCAHPLHFSKVLDPDADWTSRIRGVRLNASRLSHAELNEASALDEGDIPELGMLVGTLHKTFRHINVLGGCCGTDLRHIREIAKNIQENH